MNVTIICDRCKNIVEGYKSPDFTGGYYVTSPDSYWNKYANEGENVLCDNCMWDSPEYQKDYSSYPSSRKSV